MIASLSAGPANEVEPYTATMSSPCSAAQESGHVGQWYGGESPSLGLLVHFDEKVLVNLFLGRSPDGTPLAGDFLSQPTRPTGGS